MTIFCSACEASLCSNHKEVVFGDDAFPVCLSCFDQIKAIVLFGWKGTVAGERQKGKAA